MESQASRSVVIGVLVGIVVLWAATLPVLAYLIPDAPSSSGSLVSRVAERGQIGDAFGAINALFSGLSIAGVVYAILQQNHAAGLQRVALRQQQKALEQQQEALDLQQQELKVQIEELKQTRAELQRQANAAEKAEATMEKQRRATLLSAAAGAAASRVHAITDAKRDYPFKGSVNGVGMDAGFDEASDRATTALWKLFEMIATELGATVDDLEREQQPDSFDDLPHPEEAGQGSPPDLTARSPAAPGPDPAAPPPPGSRG